MDSTLAVIDGAPLKKPAVVVCYYCQLSYVMDCWYSCDGVIEMVLAMTAMACCVLQFLWWLSVETAVWWICCPRIHTFPRAAWRAPHRMTRHSPLTATRSRSQGLCCRVTHCGITQFLRRFTISWEFFIVLAYFVMYCFLYLTAAIGIGCSRAHKVLLVNTIICTYTHSLHITQNQHNTISFTHYNTNVTKTKE